MSALTDCCLAATFLKYHNITFSPGDGSPADQYYQACLQNPSAYNVPAGPCNIVAGQPGGSVNAGNSGGGTSASPPAWQVAVCNAGCYATYPIDILTQGQAQANLNLLNCLQKCALGNDPSSPNPPGYGPGSAQPGQPAPSGDTCPPFSTTTPGPFLQCIAFQILRYLFVNIAAAGVFYYGLKLAFPESAAVVKGGVGSVIPGGLK